METEYANNPRAQQQVGLKDRDVTRPKEPGIQDRLKELRGYLSELAEVQESQRRQLFNPEPEVGNLDRLNAKEATEPSIEHLSAICCERAAMLVGEARSILRKL